MDVGVRVCVAAQSIFEPIEKRKIESYFHNVNECVYVLRCTNNAFSKKH